MGGGASRDSKKWLRTPYILITRWESENDQVEKRTNKKRGSSILTQSSLFYFTSGAWDYLPLQLVPISSVFIFLHNFYHYVHSRLYTLVKPFLYQSQSRWVWHLTDETFRKVHLRRFVTTGELWKLKEKFLIFNVIRALTFLGSIFRLLEKRPLQVLNFHTEIRELELGQRVWIGANSKETTKYVIARVFDKKIKDFENKVWSKNSQETIQCTVLRFSCSDRSPPFFSRFVSLCFCCWVDAIANIFFLIRKSSF